MARALPPPTDIVGSGLGGAGRRGGRRGLQCCGPGLKPCDSLPGLSHFLPSLNHFLPSLRHRRRSSRRSSSGSRCLLLSSRRFFLGLFRLGTELLQFRMLLPDQFHLLGLGQQLEIWQRLHRPSILHGTVVLIATALPSAPDFVSASLCRYL